jgi:hypothetical protein
MSHGHPLTPTPDQVTMRVFDLFDVDHDHAISLTEIEGVFTAHANGHAVNTHALERVFSELDANHNGFLSPGEVHTAATALLDHVHGVAAALALADPHQLLAALGVAAHHDGWVI